MNRPLRDYQSDCINFVLNSTDLAGYYSLPTGTGKTRIVTGLVSRIEGHIVVLAHRKELIEQMASAIIADVPGESVGIIMNVRKDYTNRVTVACIATLTGSTLEEYLFHIHIAGGNLTILIDECHHVVLGSRYEQIIEACKNSYLRDHYKTRQPLRKVRIVGCTATPYRSDKLEMQSILSECFFERTIPDMQAGGWLCPVEWRAVGIPLDMHSIRTSRAGGEQDFNADDLAEQISPQSAHIIVEIGPYLEDRPCVIFCCNIAHAKEMALAANSIGLKAAPIWGNMPKADRESILRQWKEGNIQIVANVGVLTEGFDYTPIGENPHGLGMVIVARPTKSPSLYLQMIGRGTRLKPSQSKYQDCLIFDVGNANLLETKQITLPKILPTSSEDDITGDIKGKVVRSGYYKKGDIKEEKKIFTLRINDPLNTSWAAWGFYARSGIYYCELARGVYLVLLRGNSGLYRGLIIYLQYDGTLKNYQRIVDTDKPLLQLMHHINHLIASNGHKRLIDKDALWRKENCSVKQGALIKDLYPDLYCENMTKNDASLAIAWGKLRYPLVEIFKEMS